MCRVRPEVPQLLVGVLPVVGAAVQHGVGVRRERESAAVHGDQRQPAILPARRGGQLGWRRLPRVQAGRCDAGDDSPVRRGRYLRRYVHDASGFPDVCPIRPSWKSLGLDLRLEHRRERHVVAESPNHRHYRQGPRDQAFCWALGQAQWRL